MMTEIFIVLTSSGPSQTAQPMRLILYTTRTRVAPYTLTLKIAGQLPRQTSALYSVSLYRTMEQCSYPATVVAESSLGMLQRVESRNQSRISGTASPT